MQRPQFDMRWPLLRSAAVHGLEGGVSLAAGGWGEPAGLGRGGRRTCAGAGGAGRDTHCGVGCEIGIGMQSEASNLCWEWDGLSSVLLGRSRAQNQSTNWKHEQMPQTTRTSKTLLTNSRLYTISTRQPARAAQRSVCGPWVKSSARSPATQPSIRAPCGDRPAWREAGSRATQGLARPQVECGPGGGLGLQIEHRLPEMQEASSGPVPSSCLPSE